MQPLLSITSPTATVVLSNFGTAADYEVHNPVGLPSGNKRDGIADALARGNRMSGVAHRDLAERSLPLFALGADGGAAEDAVTALQRAIDSENARLVWQRTPDSRPLQCDIYSATLTEDAVNTYRREAGRVPLTLLLTTSALWRETVGTAFSLTGTAPYVGAIDSVRGDAPALAVWDIISGTATNAVGVGLMPSAGASFDPIDTYASVTYSLPSSLPTNGTVVGTPPSIDMADNRGGYEVFARASGPAAAILTRARSAVSGSGAYTSTSVASESEPAVATTTAAQKWHRVGYCKVPAAAVPVTSGEVAYGPPTQVVAQDTGTSTATGEQTQTYTVVNTGRISSFEVYGYAPDLYTPTLAWSILRGSTVIASGTAYANNSASWNVLYGPSMPTVTAGETITLKVSATSGTFYYSSTSLYSGGARTGGGDLRFRVYEQVQFTSGATVGLQAAYLATSGTLTLTQLVRVPCDYGMAAVGATFGTNEGVTIDATYPQGGCWFYRKNSAGDIGPLAADWIVDRGLLHPRPGDNDVVVIGEGTVAVSGTYYPCYTNAGAGDA